MYTCGRFPFHIQLREILILLSLDQRPPTIKGLCTSTLEPLQSLAWSCHLGLDTCRTYVRSWLNALNLSRRRTLS
jgi:hypothetical protein